jgi:hypothetical protein
MDTAPDEGLPLFPLNILSSYNLCGTSVFKSEILTLAVNVRETGLVFWEEKYITNIWEINATRNGLVEKGLKCDIQDSPVRSELLHDILQFTQEIDRLN